MLFLVSMLFGIQVLCSCSPSLATEESTALLSPTCNDTTVEEAADLALHQINTHRKEGYILRLYRIFSVREHPQITGSVFYFILDVADTECHVLSRKLWKNCQARLPYPTFDNFAKIALKEEKKESSARQAGKTASDPRLLLEVYGQCKAIFYMNQARNIAHLNTYECTLQPVPPRHIWTTCPDCPVDDCPTEPKYLEAAVQSLAKFNEESEQTHYFLVLNITKASMQWVVGPAYFVEFLIQETSCSKNDTTADISKCKPLPPEQAKIGFCKGSVVNSHLEHRQFVTISCEIYSLQDPATEEQANLRPGESSQNHQQPSETNPFSPHLEKTVGWVKILPPSTENISFQNLTESQNEHKDGKSVPPETEGSKPGLDGAKTQGDKPDLTKPVTEPVFLPFPEELSLSDSCPGEEKEVNYIIQPLLPKKPTRG